MTREWAGSRSYLPLDNGSGGVGIAKEAPVEGRKEGRETRGTIRHGQSQDCWNRRSKDEFDGDAMLGRGIRPWVGLRGVGAGTRAGVVGHSVRGHRGRGGGTLRRGDGADIEA